MARHLRPRTGHPPSRARPWRARSGGGHLALYPGGLIFAASATEDSLRDQSTVMVVPTAQVVGARVVPARAGADGVVRKGVLWRSLPDPCSSR